MDGLVVAETYVTLAEQRRILDLVAQAAATTPWYQPTFRMFGKPCKMKLDMLCLGRQWVADDRKYHDRRIDVDNAPVLPIDGWLKCLAGEICRDLWGPAPFWDALIVNRYTHPDGKLGIHQDNSESRELLDAGSPVVSISIGCTGIFFAGMDRDTATDNRYEIASGDVVIFGGEARLCYHGIAKLLPHTAPAEFPYLDRQRINLTFRQSR